MLGDLGHLRVKGQSIVTWVAARSKGIQVHLVLQPAGQRAFDQSTSTTYASEFFSRIFKFN